MKIDEDIIDGFTLFGYGRLIIYVWNWKKGMYPILGIFDGNNFYRRWTNEQEFKILKKIELGELKNGIPKGWRCKSVPKESRWILINFLEAFHKTPEELKKTIDKDTLRKLIMYNMLYG